MSVGVGGCEKNMEEVGGETVRRVDENNLSHHFLEDVAVHQEPAEKSEGTGRGCVQTSHNLTRPKEDAT